MMSPAEVEARFQRIEALLDRTSEQIAMIATRQKEEGEHITMLLEDAKTRNADIYGLIEQLRASKAERDQDAENIRALARIAEAHEHRISRLEGEPE